MAAARRRTAMPWRALSASWPVMSLACIATSLALAPVATTWRRPVRDEFWRFAFIAGPGSLATMVVAAVLVGAGLIGQAVFWLDQFGQAGALARTLTTILIREVAPLAVGIVTLGRCGLLNLAELAAMRADGTVRALEAQGLDPFLLFVLPRVLALGLCTLAHAVVFFGVAILAGHVVATLGGVTTQDLFGLMRSTTRVLGEVGYLVLPLKTLFIGFTIAAVTAVTGLDRDRVERGNIVLASGFFRALLAIFVISIVGSLVL